MVADTRHSVRESTSVWACIWRGGRSAFLQELAGRVNQIELTGEPAWSLSPFVSGIKTMPIRVIGR